MKKLLVVALIVSIAWFLGCSKLVCVTDQAGKTQISWMELTDDVCQPLFVTAYNDSMPNVSHDGKRVAFARADSVRQIIIRDFINPSEFALPPSPAFRPRWSPTGGLIAYTAGTKVNWIKSDGTGPINSTNPPSGYSDDYGHDFLDDRTIVFSRVNLHPSTPGLEECMLWMKDIVSGAEGSLGHAGKYPVVSHNGQLLAYQGCEIRLLPQTIHSFFILQVAPWRTIYSAAYSSASPPPMIPYPSAYGFSDDDAKLLFSGTPDATSKYRLYRMDVNGGNFAPLTRPGTTYNTTSPDGFKWNW
jgi:hypothetical protein